MSDQQSLRTQLHRGALMTGGAIMAGIAWAIATWVVGLFAATLPLPPGTRVAVTIAVYSAMLYYVLFETNEAGDTILDDTIGRFSA